MQESDISLSQNFSMRASLSEPKTKDQPQRHSYASRFHKAKAIFELFCQAVLLLLLILVIIDSFRFLLIGFPKKSPCSPPLSIWVFSNAFSSFFMLLITSFRVYFILKEQEKENKKFIEKIQSSSYLYSKENEGFNFGFCEQQGLSLASWHQHGLLISSKAKLAMSAQKKRRFSKD